MALLVFLMFGLISIILFHFDWYFPIWVSVALMALVVVNGDEAYEAKINPETLRELEEATYNLGIFTSIRD